LENVPPQVPIRDSYWVDPGRLLAGEYPGAYDARLAKARLEAFVRAGIRTFIDLTESRDGLEAYEPFLAVIASERQLEIGYYRFGVRDRGIPAAGVMERVLERIRDEIANARPVYVHCWGGIGRTGTVVGCWLVEQGRTPSEALDEIEALRVTVTDAFARSPETDTQRDFVRRGREPKAGGYPGR
jgi:predicted protein tyrosine phosphatase